MKVCTYNTAKEHVLSLFSDDFSSITSLSRVVVKTENVDRGKERGKENLEETEGKSDSSNL